MIHMIREHAEPLNDALKAYGIDPQYTPDEPHIRQTQLGIIIDQYVQEHVPHGGGYHRVLCHDADGGRAAGPVTVRKFYPHPAPSDKWTVVAGGHIEDMSLPHARTFTDTGVVGRELHHDTIADALKDYFGIQS